MKIGLTYDLRADYLKEGFTEEETAEFDKETTILDIERSLHHLGYSTERIGNVRQLTTHLVKGDRWDMVFNICEGLYGIGREAQVPAILDAYNIPYTFSDPLVLSLTLHKGMTKRVIRDGGLPTADFVIVETEQDLLHVNLPFPLFVKPNAEGSGRGINFHSKVMNMAELKTTCRNLWKSDLHSLLIETYLPGREFTVGILGTGPESFTIGLMEVIFRSNAADSIYSYDMKANYENFMDYELPEKEITTKCCEIALNSWKLLGCRDGGRVDVRLDAAGIPNFIEVNPLAGLNEISSDLPILARMNGFEYNFLIKTIMESAKKRANLCVKQR
jgi:D-alanine-D-alanine ligase